MAKNTKTKTKSDLAEQEYNRLIDLYTKAGTDKTKLDVNDSLIRKVAELWANLELIKDLPTLIFNKKNPTIQKETAAGKARVKYMAQFANCMQKLNKELLGVINDDDDEGLDEYSD